VGEGQRILGVGFNCMPDGALPDLFDGDDMCGGMCGAMCAQALRKLRGGGTATCTIFIAAFGFGHSPLAPGCLPCVCRDALVVRAEVNAILHKSSATLAGARIYTARMPGIDSAKLIIQSGIREVRISADAMGANLEGTRSAWAPSLIVAPRRRASAFVCVRSFSWTAPLATATTLRAASWQRPASRAALTARHFRSLQLTLRRRSRLSRHQAQAQGSRA